MTVQACIVIPHFNHHRQVGRVLEDLQSLDMPVIVVDDGSSAESVEALKLLCSRWDNVSLVQHARNRGKGAAVFSGCDYARVLGFTHAVQVDADGQHELMDIPKLLEISEADPNAIVSACPVYDDSIPKARKNGRKFAHFWTAIETISARIVDAMCGLRVYPLDVVDNVRDRHYIAPRMQFDTEILVKADWDDVPIRYMPSPVRYPEDGESHFDYFKDNVDIVIMHFRLLGGMVPRAPKLVWRHLRPNRKAGDLQAK